MSVTVGSLFSGIGGLDLAVEQFFHARTVFHCEYDKEPSKVLTARWPEVPNLGDITTVNWSQVEPVDVLCGGFPCQDLSLAGRRNGMRPGTRSGLWSDFTKAIGALHPSVVIIENVRGLLSGCAESDSDMEPCPGCVAGGGVEHTPRVRALGRVLGDLSRLGFDAEWVGLPASSVGAPHARFRVFVLAYARSIRLDARWHTASREAAGGWAPAVAGGRGDAPVDRLLPTTTAMDSRASGGKAGSSNVTLTDALVRGRVLPTPRASRGASATETMYALGAQRDDTGDRQGNVVGEGAWGEYEPAIRHWESLTRPAPAPTLPDGRNGNHRLNAAFPEWMMGYPEGWVTDILTRGPAVKACGNGVVPQQAFEALRLLWSRATEWMKATA